MRRLVEYKLTGWKDSPCRKPLIVRGARQVGKTYTISEWSRRYFHGFTSFDFEKERSLHRIYAGDLNPEALLLELEVHIGRRIVPGDALLFFDEIQACPRALLSLRYFYEQMPELHIIAVGSLLEFAMGDISFPVGRVEF